LLPGIFCDLITVQTAISQRVFAAFYTMLWSIPRDQSRAVAVGLADEIEKSGFADDGQFPGWAEGLETGFKCLAVKGRVNLAVAGFQYKLRAWLLN
jgi:hypothetical protein